jgi:hypothetical protein
MNLLGLKPEVSSKDNKMLNKNKQIQTKLNGRRQFLALSEDRGILACM